MPSVHDEEIARASRALKLLGGALGAQFDSFRNANSVYMKLANFRGIDPEYTASGRTGLARGGKADQDVWNDFADRQEHLRLVASFIRSGAESAAVDSNFDDIGGITEAPEGRIFTRLHLSRERNRQLVAEKKRLVQKQKGHLSCEICDFDFAKVYGDRGSGFIEAHHTRPVHLLTAESRTRLEDLALVCANCHRIIHAKKPWLTLDEVRSLLE
jgi:5-methylcytosine-specific restriction protein A